MFVLLLLRAAIAANLTLFENFQVEFDPNCPEFFPVSAIFARSAKIALRQGLAIDGVYSRYSRGKSVIWLRGKSVIW